MTMTILYKRYYKKIKALSHTHVFASTETADTIADLITQNGFDHPELFRRSVKPAQPTFTQPELSPTASPVSSRKKASKSETAVHISVPAAEILATKALLNAGSSEYVAALTAKALVRAETQGLVAQGLNCLPMYIQHLKTGRVSGYAEPVVRHEHGAALVVDAQGGFAYPATVKAADLIQSRIASLGVMCVGITQSHHFGVAANHLLPFAEQGLIAIAMSNTPAAVPAWGGQRPVLGTNPIAAVFPRLQQEPVIIDLSMAETSQDALMLHVRNKEPIPATWATNRGGQPTTDAKLALKGHINASGGMKGSLLNLLVELLCVSLTGAALGVEADPWFTESGNKSNLGHLILVMDPRAFAGWEAYVQRIDALLACIEEDPNIRLPGALRANTQSESNRQGIRISSALMNQLKHDAGYIQ